MTLLGSLLLSLPLTAYAASGQGQVSLWSDSSCEPGATSNFGEPDPIALNYTLSADVCGTPGGTSHSYQVLDRPTCDNGTIAAFAFYSSPGCSDAPFETPAGSAMNQFHPYADFDGLCLALVAFNSVAFICDGVGQGGSGQSSGSASTIAPSSTLAVSSIIPSASATLIAPGVSLTTPIYTYPSLPPPIGTAPSGSSPSTGPPSQPSNPSNPPQTIFTGAASELSGSIIGVVAVFGAALML